MKLELSRLLGPPLPAPKRRKKTRYGFVTKSGRLLEVEKRAVYYEDWFYKLPNVEVAQMIGLRNFDTLLPVEVVQ